MMLDAVLALGLLLTTATQLRLSGLPVGPGELCLAFWVMAMVFRTILRPAPPATFALVRMLIFWTIFGLAEALGTLGGLMSGAEYDPQWFMHDVEAYPLLAAVSCFVVLGPEAAVRLRRVAWLLTTLGAISLAAQLAAGWGLASLPLIEPWFWERFRGWSSNPNQLAFVCVVLGLISLHLVETAERAGKRMIALTCLMLSIVVGRLTQSDTFTLTLVTAGPIFLVARLRASLHPAERRSSFQTAFSWIAVIGVPLILVSVIPFALSDASDIGRLSAGLEKNGGKEAGQEADLRLTLWGEAIKVGVQSGMLGLGPGPHLPIPPSVVVGRTNTSDTPSDLPHPTQGAAPNFEAHNTILDLFTQGGLIGVLSFLWLMGTAFALTLKRRRAGLTTLLCGLAVFGMTNLIIRPPIFWFAVAICLVEWERQTSRDIAPRRMTPWRAGTPSLTAGALALGCVLGAPAHSAPSGTLHYAPNRNFGAGDAYLLAKTGFDLADASSPRQLDALPAGVMGLVWIGRCDGADLSFIRTIKAYAGNPKLYGFNLMDDPDPRGGIVARVLHRPCTAERLKAEADWIHANVPGARTFIALMNMARSATPSFRNTYNPANSHIDLFGISPYPCRTEFNGCDYDMIDRFVAAAESSGIPRGRIVPIFQAFGGGGWLDDAGGRYALPTAGQARMILARWKVLIAAPVFDVAYSWGSQRADKALESAPDLREIFLRHNVADQLNEGE